MEISTTWWIVISIIVIFDGVWKLMAMWVAARKENKKWFIVLAILNTAGILPILYYFIFSKKGEVQEMQNPETGTTTKEKLTSPTKPEVKPVVKKV